MNEAGEGMLEELNFRLLMDQLPVAGLDQGILWIESVSITKISEEGR